MSNKLAIANELQGMKNVLGGIVRMTIIKRNLHLSLEPAKSLFQEERVKVSFLNSV